MKAGAAHLGLGVALCLAGVEIAAGGTISGTVSGRGAEVPSAGADGGAYSSRRYKFAERVDYDALTDFVVYVDQVITGDDPPAKPASIVQRDAEFDPHVLPVMAGTVVRWPNEDTIYHNVFSMSETKEFNLGLYKDRTENAPTVTFYKLGRVDVFCGIHSKMHCIILVVPSRFFAVADRHGRYRIEGIPAGTYKVKAWHERLPTQIREITVPENGSATADFELSLAIRQEG